eukprot:3186345-Amphidinium_carterae.1
MPSVKLRRFSGLQAEYAEWQREAQATQMLYNISEERMAVLLFLSLDSGPGKPRDLLLHLTLQEIGGPGGLSM